MRLGQAQQEFFADLVRQVLMEGREVTLPFPSGDLAAKLRARFYVWRRTQIASMLDLNLMDVSVKVEDNRVTFYKKRDILEEILEGTKTA